MSDGTVGVRQDVTPDRLIDNEVVNVGGQDVYRQRVKAYQGDTWTVTGPLTNAELRASAVPVTITGIAQDSSVQAVRDRLPAALDADGGLKVHLQNPDESGLTDAQLRASAVPVSGPLTDAQLRASAV